MTIVLFCGVVLQVFSAGRLYSVPLSSYCQAYSGSPDFSTTVSFKELSNTALARRQACLALNGTSRDACCDKIGGYSGLCTSPSVNLGASFRATNSTAARYKMEMMTQLLGDFFGVISASRYDEANAEFWCKNCPNDVRKNCPFVPDSGAAITDSQLCSCPGGLISKPGQAFWATIGDAALASDFIVCSDKTTVYKAWIQALFPEFTTTLVEHAASRFLSKCYQGRAVVGYILIIGPVLAIISGVLSAVSLFPALANSPVPAVSFQMTMLAIALEFVAFWPLSFTGAASLISRYSFCAGLSAPVVLNASTPVKGSAAPRAAPTFYNGSPCYDLNSEGQQAENPFVQQLGVFNAGYLTGGVLVIISLVLLLGVISRHSDAVFERKLAGKITLRDPET